MKNQAELCLEALHAASYLLYRSSFAACDVALVDGTQAKIRAAIDVIVGAAAPKVSWDETVDVTARLTAIARERR